MKKEILLHGQTVQYEFKTSTRARHLRLTIRYNGDFIVTSPARSSLRQVDNFIHSKSRWILEKLAYYKNFKGTMLSGTKSDYRQHKLQALELVKDRVAFFNQIYHFKFNELKIRDQKARWGSCSKRRNLNFNYKIIFLPPLLADYLVVHELCHLEEFNHSKKFWDLVKIAVPDHKQIRRQFKNYYLC